MPKAKVLIHAKLPDGTGFVVRCSHLLSTMFGEENKKHLLYPFPPSSVPRANTMPRRRDCGGRIVRVDLLCTHLLFFSAGERQGRWEEKRLGKKRFYGDNSQPYYCNRHPNRIGSGRSPGLDGLCCPHNRADRIMLLVAPICSSRLHVFPFHFYSSIRHSFLPTIPGVLQSE